MADRPAPIPSPTAVHRLADYRPPAFLIDTVDLIFDLDPLATRVRATLSVRRNPAHGDATAPLVLDGEDLTLTAIAIDGGDLTQADYTLTPHHLTITDVPDDFTLDTEVTIAPAQNTELSGLYVSGGDLFTQCEAEGFRRITFFPDRPDVMARYSATLVADELRFPVLLSNGNPIDRGTAPDHRHWVKFSDPHPKPSYLFALVAGNLVATHDHFTTASGRAVALGIYVRQGDEDKVAHAMTSLKRAMRWDETAFGLEYDLDSFNIAAVSDFNMGAMENKGLNIFNTSLVLARPDTATDSDYQRIDRVIAHEYFHNWTGDRVTCRDWFQLSLKEGLTVFRDQQYGADTTEAALARIDDVKMLRFRQFREDAGPLAHPVRPPEYRKIDNFYTATVYEKGAEVVRMIRTIIGADAFRRGFDRYIAGNDNSAATIEDFIAAMHQESGYDFSRFMRWYDQAGTPSLSFEGSYHPETRCYDLTLRQTTAPTPGQHDKSPFVIPVAIGLIGPNGDDMATTLAGETDTTTGTRLLLLDAAETTFTFENVAAEPVPSLLRGFSAPVRLSGYDRTQLAHLAAHDSDGFNRWEAGHEYATQTLLDAIAAHQQGADFTPDRVLLDAMTAALDHAETSPALAARLLTLPDAADLADRMTLIDPEAIHTIREATRHAIGQTLHARFHAAYDRTNHHAGFDVTPASVGRRALRNVALGYLMEADPATGLPLAQAQATTSTTMTETLAALALLANTATPARDDAIAAFHHRWHADALVIDKWFRIQAISTAPDALSRIEALSHHKDFDLRNPNRFRALVGTFGTANPRHFHDASGAGYNFMARMILAVDPINRQIAARMIETLAAWKRYDPARQTKMQAALDQILAAPNLSANTREMAERARRG
ncbi:MAG: aminopeptidase N [Acidiphilium sp.]|nr:aminopeptidase N [Acidiphilium sp.]MDD4936071.1 aminopeptidase N [Acidiphilium sp.]